MIEVITKQLLMFELWLSRLRRRVPTSMSLHSDSVGRRGDVVSDLVEDRWLSNYAAAVGDENDRYFENRAGAPAVHPTYVSHLEWDSIGALHEVLDLSEAERAQGVHSFNHTDLLAPFTTGHRLDSRAVLVGAEQRRSGLRLTIRIDTHVGDTQVARSYTQTIFRGVDLDGSDVRPEVPESSFEEGDCSNGRSRFLSASSRPTCSRSARVTTGRSTPIAEPPRLRGSRVDADHPRHGDFCRCSLCHRQPRGRWRSAASPPDSAASFRR